MSEFFREQVHLRRKRNTMHGEVYIRTYHTGIQDARDRADAEFVMGALMTAGGGDLTARVNNVDVRTKKGTAHAVVIVTYAGSRVFSAT